MKTLYEILGVTREASQQRIEDAYASLMQKLEGNNFDLVEEELRNQKVAVREAYATLSNPILRQRYDLKIDAAVRPNTEAIVAERGREEGSGGIFRPKVIALIGVFALGGIYLYGEKQKEREQLRIQHEHEVQMRAAQLEEEKQRHLADLQDQVLEKASANLEARQRLAAQMQFERQSAMDSRNSQILYQQQQSQQRQQQRQLELQAQREQAAQERQRQYEAQQRAAADRRALRQMEIDHYGRAITP